jgi:ectoine hydroxylase-related dioxygenase (phytanoyl-CoA dioxygenase family)
VSRSIAHHLAEMANQGFTIVPDVFSAAEVERMRAAVEAIFAAEEGALGGHGAHVRFSVNLTNKHATFREAVQHPLLVELMGALLGDDFILGSLHTRSTYPGAPRQGLHRDGMLDRRIPFPTHINSMWMLDDFTVENGATRVVPGSHLWEEEPAPDQVYAAEVQATGAAGSVAVFDSRLFHAGGANHSSGPRRGLTGFFCRSWAKPQEDHTRSVDQRHLDGASPLLIRLWGFHAQVPWEEPYRPNEMHQLPAPGVPEWRPG